MTGLTCPECNSVDVHMTGDNGADYPQTRVEFYECNQCGYTFSKVLTP